MEARGPARPTAQPGGLVRSFARGPDEVGRRLRGPSALDRRLENGFGPAALLGALPAELETLYRLGFLPIVLTLRERVRVRRGLLPTLPRVRPPEKRADWSGRALYPWESADEVLADSDPRPAVGILLVADLWALGGRTPSKRRVPWTRVARVGRVFRPVTAYRLAELAAKLEVPVRIDPQVDAWLRFAAVELTGSPYQWPGNDVRVDRE